MIAGFIIAAILALLLLVLWQLRGIEQVGKEIDDERNLP